MPILQMWKVHSKLDFAPYKINLTISLCSRLLILHMHSLLMKLSHSLITKICSTLMQPSGIKQHVKRLILLWRTASLHLFNYPLDTKPLVAAGCKIKQNADGSIERYKGRLVAKDFSQHPGWDFIEPFAPTPKWIILRAILAIASAEDLELESVDISSAFLHGEIDSESTCDNQKVLLNKILPGSGTC